ncbi:right-handed parallel beta-helix repeat-containing protein [Pseudoalteromonas sp. BZB3]|uniref:right-handed parallel beta-helix repeat-containing protein n=1 Tax=Pseudoalteromonas sp. BZB3 TaxID=3136670 RepID=UPI0032C3FA48
MKTNKISFLVRLYTALFQVTGKRPPRGSLAHLIDDHYYAHQFQDILNSFFQTNATAIHSQASGATIIRDCKITNCGTGVKTEGPQNLIIDNLEVEDCGKAFDIEDKHKSEGLNMGIEINRGKFKNNKTVLKATETANVKVNDIEAENNDVVFDIYSPELELILRQHGLTEKIPSDTLLEAKEVIGQLSPHMKKEDIVPVMEEKKLGQWLNEAAITCSLTGVNIYNIMLAVITYFA